MPGSPGGFHSTAPQAGTVNVPLLRYWWRKCIRIFSMMALAI